MKSRNTLPAWMLATIIAATSHSSAIAAASDEDDYEKLVADKSAALVTLKFVLKTKMGDLGDEEREQEISGVMIEPKGLVICSNMELGGTANRLAALFGRESSFSATPTDLKVLIGDDNQGLDAELLARDSELDLAWVKIRRPGEKPFAAVDLSKAGKARLGARLLALDRLDKFYGRAPWVGEVRISSMPRKPRELLVPTGDTLALGIPIFTRTGELIGVTIGSLPDADAAAADMESILDTLADSLGTVILPVDEVAKATTRAMQGAKTDDAAADDASKKDE